MTPPLALIVALAENGVIGKGNSLPWHISSDLKRFRALTMGKPLIMGRKTFQSIGRALPGRDTIVVSRDAAFTLPPGVHRAETIDAALALALARATEMGADEIMLAGGGEIFTALIDRADRMYVTFVQGTPEGDAFFPAIDWSQWQEVRREAYLPQKGDEVGFSFVDFVRRDRSKG
ncbi:dihydrofolate reductase [Methylovirgula sp. HY1]|uniref:dihydrofolate reductase n=1 Tax=Methylovirgula sp. HY1 TaxID=2822761 RepID=UPI001C5B6C72|nr:dihydrofolate reductase [Methylovirgula sp. HY1]QXX75684.1 Dihydrofolate reductase type 3 [Methylovirgula sp. HY1]